MTARRKTKVLIVHEVPLTRFALAQILKRDDRFQVSGEPATAPIARDLFVKHKPDVVLLGLSYGMQGFDLVKDFHALHPAAAIVVLLQREHIICVTRLFRAGVRGYLTSDDGVDEVLRAIQEVSAGHFYASPFMADLLIQSVAKDDIGSAKSDLVGLSDRELQVFFLIGSGFGASQLASRLHLSVRTIETHQMHIKEKLGLQSAADVSRRAREWSLSHGSNWLGRRVISARKPK